MAARQNCRSAGGDWCKSKFSDIFGPSGEFCRSGDVRDWAISHRGADYSVRGIFGHAGWAGGTAAESRYGVWRVLRFDAGSLCGHGAVHGIARLLFGERTDAVRGAGGGGDGGLGDGELCTSAGRIADSAV